MNEPNYETTLPTFDHLLTTATTLAAGNPDKSASDIASKAADLLEACYFKYPDLLRRIPRAEMDGKRAAANNASQEEKKKIEAEWKSKQDKIVCSFTKHLEKLMPGVDEAAATAIYRRFLKTFQEAEAEEDPAETIRLLKEKGVDGERDLCDEHLFPDWRKYDIREKKSRAGKLGGIKSAAKKKLAKK